MNNQDCFEDEDRLCARLADEAAANRPEFSQPLHDRIMESVRAASDTVVRRSRRRIGFRLAVAGSAATVAALLLAAWLVRGVGHEAPAPREAGPRIADPEPAPGHSDAPETALTVVVTPAADRLTALVDATFAGSQWAYLDHDVQLAASMVVNHLPFELPVAEVP